MSIETGCIVYNIVTVMKTNASANNFLPQKNYVMLGHRLVWRGEKRCFHFPEMTHIELLLWTIPRPQSVFPNTKQPVRNSHSKIFSSSVVVVSFVKVYFNLFYFCYSPCREAKTSREKILHRHQLHSSS